MSQDLKLGLYESVYLNFTSSIPRPLLEDLAQQVVECDTSNIIAKVYDQYLNFECLERNLFTLLQPNCFQKLNDPKSSDSQIEGLLEQVSAGLFSVMLTMGGQVPIICASKGTAAEMVGSKLEKKLKNHLLNTRSTNLGESNFGESAVGLQRPLVLILDRNFDLAGPLKHVSTYNALVHDVLGMKLNRVNIVTKDGPKTFDIDSSDYFWQENARLPFPSVAENVDAALNKYKNDMQQVTRNGGVTSIEQVGVDMANNNMTAEELKFAISVLPELTERKRLIDCHLQLATALLEKIKSRDLGNLFSVEQNIGELTKPELLKILQNPEQGSPADKLRLFLIYFLSNEISPTDLLSLEKTLREVGCDMAALESVKKLKSLNNMAQFTITKSSVGAKQQSTGSDLFSKFTSTTTGVLGNIVSSVKNLLPESIETPLTKHIDMALELTTGVQTSVSAATALRGLGGASTASVKPEDVFTTFDPKTKSASTAQSPGARPSFNHLIVFVVGGATYSEYNHVEEYIGSKRASGGMTSSKLQVTFGATDMMTGDDFLRELGNIA